MHQVITESLQIMIIDSNPLEMGVLSDFIADLGYAVGACYPASAYDEYVGGAAMPVDVVIAGVSAANGCGMKQLEKIAAPHSRAALIVLADPEFALDQNSEVIDAVHAVVRRPIHLQELEWMLARISRTKQAGAI